MFAGFNWQQMISAFIVLFAVIDIIGSIPIILNLKQKGRNVNANKATFISFALLLGFFYAGDMMLKLFQVDIASFAVAGAFVIFLMSLEMILDIEIFKNQGPIKEATLVPLVFPLLAGAGAFTTLLSLRSEYAPVNIVIALVLNMVWVYVVLKLTDRIERRTVPEFEISRLWKHQPVRECVNVLIYHFSFDTLPDAFMNTSLF